ncbi:hypothetical protein BT69DRAFT_1294192 [Atractiella rhizophila]|nr:hypothetical protein BT69DRAFT_1294192 [Atractiella rhizophila]
MPQCNPQGHQESNVTPLLRRLVVVKKYKLQIIFWWGLLTMEFLVGNSSLEMGPPLQDFAQRAQLLGVNFEARADFVVAFREAILQKKADLQEGRLARWASEPFCGSASSLTTVLSVLPNIFLRKNLLVKIKNRSQPADSPSQAFRKKVIEAGTHHIFLVDRNLRLEEILYSSSRPKLLDVFSKHEFGLVKREKQFTGVDLDRYKAKRKELLQTLKPDDIEHPEVIVMAVMNGTVVMNGELPVDSDVEMEVFPKAKPENTPLQHSAISSSCLPEKRMATQLDSEEDDATTTLTISSKRPHLNR